MCECVAANSRLMIIVYQQNKKEENFERMFPCSSLFFFSLDKIKNTIFLLNQKHKLKFIGEEIKKKIVFSSFIYLLHFVGILNLRKERARKSQQLFSSEKEN